MICPPSMLFLANLSGCHAIKPIGSLLSWTLLIISLKISRPGFFALFDSIKVSAISIFSRLANSANSASWASMLIICRSSSSVDLRAYKKYLVFILLVAFGCKAGDKKPGLGVPRSGTGKNWIQISFVNCFAIPNRRLLSKQVLVGLRPPFDLIAKQRSEERRVGK